MASVDLRSRTASADRIDLDWTALEPVDSGFEVQRRAASGVEYETIAIVDAADRAYADSGLTEGTTYVYRVLTLSGADRTGYSNESAATTDRSVVASGGGGSGGGGGCFVAADFAGWDDQKEARIRAIAIGALLVVLVLVVSVALRRSMDLPAAIDAPRRREDPKADRS
ncbi:MAG TPA: fibronectin type III domain-containing protein [Desulfosarcina sp.]|nr:fibronectin type III domain-containing protein [Desulfosarcina sp.]